MSGCMCFSGVAQEKHSLKLSEFRSKTTYASIGIADEFSDDDYNFSRSRPNISFCDNSGEDKDLMRGEAYLTASCRKPGTQANPGLKSLKSHEATNLPIKAFVGLPAILEEETGVGAGKTESKYRYHRAPTSLSNPIQIAEKATRKTQFPSYGSMKHYQRFVESN